MPTHRGIKINIISQWELKVHPEFPHPESSQLAVRSAGLKQAYCAEEFPPAEEVLDNKSDHLLGQQAFASVYISSCSGARFWVRWTLTESAIEDSQWYYFKLFMNGRHITSWGTNAYEKPSGQVMRGLFEPSERWNYKNEGTVYKNMGTEARPFIFAKEEEGKKSAATDGGIIEVHAFRAIGRKRRLAEPTHFKNQEACGIIMPSGGLLERPQDAKFYDWHLKDPKESPFATFKFHYRSWDSLCSLQLIPDDHPRALLSPTSSILDILNPHDRLQFEFEDLDDGGDELDAEEEVDNEDVWEDEVETPMADQEDRSRGSITSEVSDTPWLTNVFDDSPPANKDQERRLSSGLQYEKAPVHPDPHKVDLVSRFSNAAAENPRFQDKTICKKRQKIVERPLPEIPQRTSSKKSGRSRGSSTASGAPSITPSLWSYAERGESSSPEPFIGVATAVPMSQVIFSGKAKLVDIPSRKSQVKVPAAENTPPVTSPEMKAGSIHIPRPPSMTSEFTPPMRTSPAKDQPNALDSSPLTEFFNQPNIANITVRKHKRSPGNLLSRLSISGSSFRSGSPFRSNSTKEKVQNENSEQTPSATSNTPISLTESQWMYRTPSPVKSPDNERYANMWSPSPGSDGKTKKSMENGSEGVFNGSPASIADNGVGYKKRRDTQNNFKNMTNRSPGPTTVTKGGEKAEKRIGSKERLSKKALDWYEQVRSSKDENADTTILVDDPKVRTGWI